MTEQHLNHTPLPDTRSSRFSGLYVWLVPTVMWCPLLLIVTGLAFGYLPLTHSLWLSWASLALVVLSGWMSSLLTAHFVEPTIPPHDLPNVPACLYLSVVGGLAALLTGTIAASLDNQITANLAANPVHRFAFLLGITGAGVSLGLSKRLGVAQSTANSFTIGAALGVLVSNSIGIFVVFTLIWAAGAVRFSIVFPDKRQFLKLAATRWKTWSYRLTWLMVWFTLILVPAAYIHLIVLCLFGQSHW